MENFDCRTAACGDASARSSHVPDPPEDLCTGPWSAVPCRDPNCDERSVPNEDDEGLRVGASARCYPYRETPAERDERMKLPYCTTMAAHYKGEECPEEAPEALCGPVGSEETCAPQCCRDGRPGAAMTREEAKEDAERATSHLGRLIVDGFKAQGLAKPIQVPPKRMTREELIASLSVEDRIALGLEKAPSVLEEAQSIVNGPRRASYGHPSINFERIALLWNAYLKAKLVGLTEGETSDITAQDVTQMMIHLKQCRLIQNPKDRDGHLDVAGYAQCSALIAGIDP